MVDNKFLQKLSQNLLEILDDDDYYDIKIEVGKDPYVKVFRAHMVILSYRSPYLRRILSTNTRRDDGTSAHIKLPNILPEIFQIILRYIYGGRLDLETYDTLNIINILEAANELGLQELIAYLQIYLVENKADWIEQNFTLIYQTSLKYDSFLKLQQFCTELMSKKPEKIFESLDFVLIPENSLISLIRNDNLQMSEVQVWEHVLKWGLAQNPGLSSDPSSYSNDDFNALKNTIQQSIPFIRFYNFTSKEFLDKVYRYKKILPEELCDDLIKYFLDPNSKPDNILEPRGNKRVKLTDFDSNIISNKHVELISKWIDKVDDNTISSRKSYEFYEFRLMLRGTRDGFSTKKFHELCDNQSRTVSIIKVKGNNEIVGGYNPIEWKSSNSDEDEFGITKDSFVFSFKDKENIDNYILSRVKNERHAINYKLNRGLLFGKGDIVMINKWGFCVNRDYEKQIKETSDEFVIEEYEVFQII